MVNLGSSRQLLLLTGYFQFELIETSFRDVREVLTSYYTCQFLIEKSLKDGH